MNLYIHVPFCAQRCSYCDFYTQTNLGLRSHYIQSLICELQHRRSELLSGECIQHIYFGGGTPSLLSPRELEVIFEAIYRLYPVALDAEVTLEANPDDLTVTYAEALRSLPINRVSMGVQSFQEDDLRFLNRRHNRQQVYDAVARLHQVGVTNLSLDLIYGLPGQTEATLTDNLQRITSIGADHISAYHLIYEEGTPLTRLRDLGRVSEVAEEASLRFFTLVIDVLEAFGYEQYEISNFARHNRYAKLNMGYWFSERYMGVGPSAHSYDGEIRSYNIASTKRYIEGWSSGRRQSEVEELTPRDKHNEYIMTRLRTKWGIDLHDFERHFGVDALTALISQAESYLRCRQLEHTDGALRLSRSGVFVSDGIIASLFH